MEFIRSYENTLSDELLSNLIMLATNQVTWKSNRHNNRTDKQMAIEPYWPDLASQINHSLLRCFDSYLEEFPYLKELGEDWMSGHIILQQTNPTEGYHAFHAENTQWNNAVRTIAWMIYLNDVEEGGETEFLYQKMRIKPTKNTCLLWPGSFTHLHRGLPPLSGSKFILTGWYTPLSGSSHFRFGS